ncbi:bglB [Symbiodinium sp. KB8]|nr:bglB [Symbiodinium sp. KB8]
MLMVTPKRPEDYLPPGINLEPWAADKVDVAPTYPYSHGFKHMWDRDIQPRFPFGWGLSYTSFQHSNLAAELDLENTRILVRTEVRNTGSQAGLETIQVYAQCKACRKRRLPVQLVAFTKVSLQPGKTKVVDLVVELRDLAAYDVQAPAEGSWHLEGGVYAIFAGSAASAEFLQRAEVHIAETQTFRYPGRAKGSAGRVDVDAVECKGKECAPDPQLIQGASVPSRLPLDPFMLFVFAIVYRVPLGCAGAIAACLLLCRCCRGKGQVADNKKES